MLNILKLRLMSPQLLKLLLFFSLFTLTNLPRANSQPIAAATDVDRLSQEAETEDIEEQDISAEREASESDEEPATAKPSPEELARLEKIAIADQLYLAGDKQGAVKLYRQAKPAWKLEDKHISVDKPKVFEQPDQLSHAGKVFWRNYQQGQQQQLESKILSSLKLLTTREPQFLPGHLYYAEALMEAEREANAIAVLDRAVSLYPNEPLIIRAKLDADVMAENWLDASILARQYALFNPDAPQAAEFTNLAEEYLAEYQRDLRSSITWNAVGNAIAGTVGFALTGNIFGPLSALQTTSLLLQGESAVGDAAVSQIKQRVPLLKNEAVNEYVNRIGQKVAGAAGRDEFDYEFHVVMDDTLNAFALPGGKIFVNAGAIMQIDSEAELAGLLAHEVAHSALSHGFQLTTKGNLTANIVSYIPYVGNAASSLIVLNYSRTMEKQADIFGTRILVNTGYAADGVRNLMAKLQAAQDPDNPEPLPWFSTHPNTGQRIAYLEQLIIEQNLDRYAYEGVYRHQSIKQLVTEQWQDYETCIEEIDTLQEAKVCAGEQEQEAQEYKEATLEEER
ncbi:MAG: M48 family metallopeptidase [Cyanobacteria bacterium J06623_7]